MQHFADFGIVKRANKQLKNMKEIQKTMPFRLGKITAEAASENPDKALKYLVGSDNRADSSKRLTRQKRSLANIDPLTKPVGTVTHPYYGNTFVEEYNTQRPPNSNWSDVRKTNDKAASSTGYLGFRTDPYKGYGGMMEESIPLSDFPITKKYYSRLTGNTVK
jgi:hypothetical protein